MACFYVRCAAVVSASASEHPRPPQTARPGAPSRAGYTLLDEQAVDRFVLQRWVGPGSPTGSLSGYCDCVVVVFANDRQVLDLGVPSGTVRADALKHLTGDGLAELVTTT